MNKINILVTGGGSPGIMGTIYSLKNNYDQRDVQIICTDAKSDCVGKYIADKREGKWEWFWLNTNLQRREVFKNDEIISQKCFERDGSGRERKCLEVRSQGN